MKKALLGIVLCLILAVVAFPASFSLKLNGGVDYLLGGDYNKIVEGENGYWGVTGSDAMTKLNWGLDFGAEFIVSLSDSLGLGLGVGFISATQSSNLTYRYSTGSTTEHWNPSNTAIPITLNAHLFLPLGPLLKLHVTAGPGLYLYSYKWDMKTTTSAGGYDWNYSFKADSVAAFGFQGGLGLELALSPAISLTMDIQGRLANFSGLKGPWTVTGQYSPGHPFSGSGAGTLWYFEESGLAYFEVQANKPTNPSLTNVREGSFSLSGVRALVGIKFNL